MGLVSSCWYVHAPHHYRPSPISSPPPHPNPRGRGGSERTMEAARSWAASVLPPELAAAAGGDPLAALAVTAAALVAGLLILAFWFRSESGAPAKQVAAQSRPPPVKIVADADVDDGRTRVTIFFGTQTGTAEGFAKVHCLIGSVSFGCVPSVNFRTPCLTRSSCVCLQSMAEEARARYEKAVFKVVDLVNFS
jgi:NADPH-ferrihemoprotein reductase